MSFPSAPRIDARLRYFIAGAAGGGSAAEITRAAGALAWSLGLPRPSYQQVRVIVRAAEPAVAAVPSPSVASTVLTVAGNVFDFMYQYPGPGLEDWYRRWKKGLV